MSVRQDVFSFLTDEPEATLDRVLEKFSTLKESTVRRYFFEYQKIDKKRDTPKPKSTSSKKASPPQKKARKKSIKDQVYDYMQKAPDAKLKDLAVHFSEHPKTTIGNYRRQWLKENAAAKQTLSKSKRNEIFSYLDNNPGSNINDLKKVFPDVANKLVTVFRSWKNSQVTSKPTEKPSGTRKGKSKDTASSQPEQGWLERHKETIARQKEMIDRQKSRIESLKSQLPKIKKPGFIDSLKRFIANKLSK